MSMDTTPMDWALSKGVPGVLALVVLAQAYIIRVLWDKTNTLQDERDKIQDSRLEDATKNTAALLGVTENTNNAVRSLEHVSDNFDTVIKSLANNRSKS